MQTEQSDCWPPMSDRVVEVLREAREGRYYGKNDGWLNARQIRNVIVNTERPYGSPPIELLTSVWPVRRALRLLPHEIIEKRIARRLTQYRLTELANSVSPSDGGSLGQQQAENASRRSV